VILLSTLKGKDFESKGENIRKTTGGDGRSSQKENHRNVPNDRGVVGHRLTKWKIKK